MVQSPVWSLKATFPQPGSLAAGQHLAAEKCWEGAEFAGSSWFVCSQNGPGSQWEDEGWSRGWRKRAQGSLWSCQGSLPGCSCLHTQRGPEPIVPAGSRATLPATLGGPRAEMPLHLWLEWHQWLDHGCSEHQGYTFPFPGVLSFSSGAERSQGHISTA